MLESGPAVQEGIQLLSHPNLHPVLHARYRVLGVLLAGSERRACPSVTRYKLFVNSSKHNFQNFDRFLLQLWKTIGDNESRILKNGASNISRKI